MIAAKEEGQYTFTALRLGLLLILECLLIVNLFGFICKMKIKESFRSSIFLARKNIMSVFGLDSWPGKNDFCICVKFSQIISSV